MMAPQTGLSAALVAALKPLYSAEIRLYLEESMGADLVRDGNLYDATGTQADTLVRIVTTRHEYCVPLTAAVRHLESLITDHWRSAGRLVDILRANHLARAAMAGSPIVLKAHSPDGTEWVAGDYVTCHDPQASSRVRDGNVIATKSGRQLVRPSAGRQEILREIAQAARD